MESIAPSQLRCIIRCLGLSGADLANCKLMTFPIGIYKAMRSVTEGIHCISLANNELKSITNRFVTTFNQLRGKGSPTASQQPLPNPQDPSKSPQVASEKAQHQSFPTAVFASLHTLLIPSYSSPPPRSIFLHPFQPLQEGEN